MTRASSAKASKTFWDNEISNLVSSPELMGKYEDAKNLIKDLKRLGLTTKDIDNDVLLIQGMQIKCVDLGANYGDFIARIKSIFPRPGEEFYIFQHLCQIGRSLDSAIDELTICKEYLEIADDRDIARAATDIAVHLGIYISSSSHPLGSGHSFAFANKDFKIDATPGMNMSGERLWVKIWYKDNIVFFFCGNTLRPSVTKASTFIRGPWEALLFSLASEALLFSLASKVPTKPSKVPTR